MLEGAIILLEISLAALLVLLAYRLTALARSEWRDPAPLPSPTSAPPPPLSASGDASAHPPQPTPSQQMPGQGFGVQLSDHRPLTATPDRTELITQLHILLALQEKVCRDAGLLLETLPDSVKWYVVAWAYGAASGLSGVWTRHSDQVIAMTARLVAKKIGCKQSAAVQAIATLTDSSSMLACYRNGLDSAEHWLQHHHVPGETALNHAITSVTLI
ncbi:MAG: hypothetical protein R3175_03205 [Marinobacter sp.]|uniref:hypothetical protein n=1 Tax=Marinobacter sp. TaxID=50741 RepID=UPI00299EC32C|nr:hypothetical protein [Marinobacter sp.]MDX1755046.1 hypothetical protein [Marinobacter sp.]